MKQLLTFALLLLTMTAGAQTWEKQIIPGDELKGTTETTKYLFVDSVGKKKMAFYGDGDYWKVLCGYSVFDPIKGKIHSRTKNMIAYATIGFYDEQHQLIKKWDNCLVELTNGLRIAEATENIWGKTTKGCRDVVPYLTNERGYIRILIPVAIGKEFDLTVPCLNNE